MKLTRPLDLINIITEAAPARNSNLRPLPGKILFGSRRNCGYAAQIYPPDNGRPPEERGFHRPAHLEIRHKQPRHFAVEWLATMSRRSCPYGQNPDTPVIPGHSAGSLRGFPGPALYPRSRRLRQDPGRLPTRHPGGPHRQQPRPGGLLCPKQSQVRIRQQGDLEPEIRSLGQDSPPRLIHDHLRAGQSVSIPGRPHIPRGHRRQAIPRQTRPAGAGVLTRFRERDVGAAVAQASSR